MRTSLALLIAIAGCGDDGGALPDARPDAPPADALPDAGGPVVKLTITDGDVPAAGATVYFQNPDSSLVAKVLTDADGVAIAALPDGGYVTAIEPRPLEALGAIVLRDRLSTFAGVKPGDELHLDVRPVRLDTTTSFSVTIPEDPDPDASQFKLFTPCGTAMLALVPPATSQPASLTGCGPITDMVLVSSNDAAQLLRAVLVENQPLTQGGMITIAGPYTEPVSITVDVVSSPAWVASYLLELVVTSPRGQLLPQFGIIDPSSATSTALSIPALTGTAALLRADVHATQPGFERQVLLAWGLPYTAQTLDMGTRALRPLTSRPAFDPTTRTVSWTDAAGLSPSTVRTEVYTYRDGDPATAWHWQMIAPHAGTSLTYPVLQGEAATAFTTTTADSFNVTGFETLATEGGYDRIRPHGLRRTLDAALPGPPGQLSYQRMEDPNLLVPFTRGAR